MQSTEQSNAKVTDNADINTQHNNSNNKISIEVPLDKSVIGRVIKVFRKLRNYSQTKLGMMIGVNKAQVSKLENNNGNITLLTLIKVFKALKAKISLKVEIEGNKNIKDVEQISKEVSAISQN